MKLAEALALNHAPAPPDSAALQVFLATGFTPLHLQTFLAAHLRLRFPSRPVEIVTGLFGDLPGNLDRIAGGEAAAVLLEYPDFDPRLGVRRLGGWGPSDLADIVEQATRQAGHLRRALERVSQIVPVVLSLPTLPLPPVFFTAGWQASGLELQLREVVAGLAALVGQSQRIKVVNAQYVDRRPPSERFDLKSELSAGFPYTIPHADVLGEALAILIRDRPPLKGLITDLDDTLWKGLLGEAGVAGVSWSLDGHSQMHGLYQQVLHSLSETGVLIAVASKNDPGLVEAAFAREDLLLPKDDVFPFEVNWGRKSESVTRILSAWNIAADSVVFIDDSELEVAEVKASHPGMECIHFPSGSPAGIYDLLAKLRDRFGKQTISQEDSIRAVSLRNAQTFQTNISTSDPDEFLAGLRGSLSLDFGKSPPDPRALELVNKTNQFNLNGRRYSDAEWAACFRDPDSFLLVSSYTDKFGPLGRIAVVAGRQEGTRLSIHTWVMSCRAFSRRIEHQCLEQLFERLGVEEVVFDFAPTSRNEVLRQFLESLLGAPAEAGARLTRSDFAARRPSLFHQITTAAGSSN
jgi:FkbH-like protein